MIICKRLNPQDDYLQAAGPSGWSFAKGRILQRIICKRLDPLDDHQEARSSELTFASGRSLQMIICKWPDHPGDPLQEAGSFRWSFATTTTTTKKTGGVRGPRGSIGSSKTICKNGKHGISILQSDVVEPVQPLVDSDQILAGETSFTPYTCISQPHAH